MMAENLTIGEGSILCALGAHAPSVVAAMSAGLDRLVPLRRFNDASPPLRVGIVRGLSREASVPHLAVAMLADAVDYLLASNDTTRPRRYAAMFAVPETFVPGPLGTVVAEGGSAAAAAVDGVEAGLSAFLWSRFPGHAPTRIRVFLGDCAGAQCMAAAVEMLRDDKDLDGCLVAASDVKTHARTAAGHPVLAAMDLPADYAIGDAAAALWLLRAPEGSAEVRLRSMGTGGSTTSAGAAVRHAVVDALANANISLGDVKHLVHDAPWGNEKALLRETALRLAHPKQWFGERWSPARSIGDVGVASGIIQTLQAAYLARREGLSDSALVLLSDAAQCPAAWVVSAPARSQTHTRTRLPWAW